VALPYGVDGEPVARIVRHDSHGREIFCRPAGNGLCEPLDPAAVEAAARFKAWREAVALEVGDQEEEAGSCWPGPGCGC
jgi:hypothetical protein